MELPSTAHVQLTSEQLVALDKATNWYRTRHSKSFLLDGAAGTGKTFCLQKLLDVLNTNFVIFTAPTNKAVKVLSQTLRQAGIHAPCCTIYSALGLKMQPNGDVKELTPTEKSRHNFDWNKYQLVVLDEASMVGQVLLPHIDRLQSQYGVQFIYVGDSAQLPPVGEAYSAVMHGDWNEQAHASLVTVVRQENQILTLASAIRAQIGTFIPRVALHHDNANDEGVWLYSTSAWADKALLRALDQGLFARPGGAKCIAWRNVIVNKLNKMIRLHLYPETQQFFVEGDRVIVTEPFNPIARGSNEKMQGTFITTDSEGRVEYAELVSHPWYPEFPCWALSIIGDDEEQFEAYVLTDDAKQQKAWRARKDALAQEARADRRKWAAFWRFVEAFNGIRHGYAITAHRAQGSTYDQAFVNYSDILLNQNRHEAFRCLYVACSRPKYQLHLW